MDHGQLLHITEAEGERLRAARPDDDTAELLAGAYHALGDPTRLGLALALRGDAELCVCDLAEMLGVRRTSVTEVASNIQRLGAITYSRGVIQIVDRGALESLACECYQTLLAH